MVTVGLCKSLGIEFVKGDMAPKLVSHASVHVLNKTNKYDNDVIESFTWRKGPIPEKLEFVDLEFEDGAQEGVSAKYVITNLNRWRPSMEALKEAAGLATAVMLTLEMSDKIQELYSGAKESCSSFKTLSEIAEESDIKLDLKGVEKLKPTTPKKLSCEECAVLKVLNLAKNLGVDLKELANKL